MSEADYFFNDGWYHLVTSLKMNNLESSMFNV